MRNILLAAAVVLGLMAPAWADFDDGEAALERGDYATAFKEFLPLAEQGDAAAQVTLADMHVFGLGVPRDYARAAQWYRKAAEQGHAKAQFILGVMYDACLSG